MMFTYVLPAILGLALLALLLLRLWDWRAERIEWLRLAARQSAEPQEYDPSMVADLPEAAQRFFTFTITPGTPLLTVAEIDMGGQFSLGSRENPQYRQMKAKQILAAPWGFLWKLRLPGTVPITGSDSGRWTRFRILGLFPVVRIGGSTDHTRSAYGRYVAEAVFWTPAALLPGPGVIWEKGDENSACVTVNHAGLSQTVTIRVGMDGQPIEVSFLRWSNANPEKLHRLQPFGGKMSDFRDVQGFRLPFNVEAGNNFGTEDYFPFFKAEVQSIRFLSSGSSENQTDSRIE